MTALSRVVPVSIARASILCLVLLLSGCMQNPFMIREPLQNHAVDYYLWLKSASATAVSEEIERLKQQQDIVDPLVRSVRMALLLSVPEQTTAAEEQLALQLLNRVIDSPYTAPDQELRDYRQFALIWKDILEQRQELSHSIDNLTRDLTEKQRLIQTLRKENAAYTQKIEALKRIEQQINDREQSHDAKSSE